MRQLVSTLLGILLLLVVLEATDATNDNNNDEQALETPNSFTLTSRKIQQQRQQQGLQQGQGGNSNQQQGGNVNDDAGNDDIFFDGRDEYVDSSREIDCKLVPRYCEEKGVNQGQGGQSIAPGQPGTPPTTTAPVAEPDDGTPANIIALRVSVGLTDANRRSQSHLARYTARVITSLLDRYSPFSVKSRAPPRPGNRVLESLEEEEEEQQVYPVFQWIDRMSNGRMLLTQEAAAAKRTRRHQRVLVSKRLLLERDMAVNEKSHGTSTQEQQQRQLDYDNLEHPPASRKVEHLLQQYYGNRDEDDDRNHKGSTSPNTDSYRGKGNENTHNSNRILNDDSPPRAKIFHLDTHTERVRGYDQDWMVVQVSYTVFKNTDRPISNRGSLKNISDICSSVLNATIVSGHFLDYLQQLIQKGKDDNVQDSSHDSEDSTTPWNPDDDPNEDNEVYLGVALVGEEFSLADGAPREPGGAEAFGDLQPGAKIAGGSTYPTPLQLGDPWGTCEWLGLVLFLFLIFSTTILTYFSVWIKRRQSQQQLWGTQRLTESGVGDLLNVGWRYQEGGEQLFLQVFDKGKLGYNDDNSMLMGGVVDQPSTPTTLPSSTVTTTTPEQS